MEKGLFVLLVYTSRAGCIKDGMTHFDVLLPHVLPPDYWTGDIHQIWLLHSVPNECILNSTPKLSGETIWGFRWERNIETITMTHFSIVNVIMNYLKNLFPLVSGLSSWKVLIPKGGHCEDGLVFNPLKYHSYQPRPEGKFLNSAEVDYRLSLYIYNDPDFSTFFA